MINCNLTKETKLKMLTHNNTPKGLLTYYIPHIHRSITEEFLKNMLHAYWCAYSKLGFFVDKYDCLRIDKIKFITDRNNPKIKKAVVYHCNSSKDNDNDNDEQSNKLVNNFMSEIIAHKENSTAPLKCYFTQNGERRFWLILPNMKYYKK